MRGGIDRITDRLLAEGVEIHLIDGVDVSVFGIARTIADCFRHRKSGGLSIAIHRERFRTGSRALDLCGEIDVIVERQPKTPNEIEELTIRHGSLRSDRRIDALPMELNLDQGV